MEGQVGMGMATCSTSPLSLPVWVETVSTDRVTPLSFGMFSRVRWRRGDKLVLLDSDSTEPWDWASTSRLISNSVASIKTGDVALLLLVREDVRWEDAVEGEVMGALHIGQFCLIFNHGSTHFLWNSCLCNIGRGGGGEEKQILLNVNKLTLSGWGILASLIM